MAKFEKIKHIITSAQAFAKPNHKFLDNLDALLKREEANMHVLPMIGNSAREDYDMVNFADRIQEYGLTFDKPLLNNKIGIEQFNVRPYQIDPITGLTRFPQRERTLVFASPKQRWRYVPHSNSKLPKALIATGAVTEPNYATGRDFSAERRRLGEISRRDHEFGAILVDIVNDSTYHWRNIMGLHNGAFTDMGIEYNSQGKKEVRPLAMVVGDWHAGYTNKRVRKATLDMMEEFKPKKIILHDIFDGHSVSHHAHKQFIFQLMREGVDKGNLNLEDELSLVNNELWAIAESAGDAQIYIPAANHHEFLNRYLDEGRFLKDPRNAKLAFKLAEDYANGYNPVEVGVRMMGTIPDNVTWLNRFDDLKVNGYQLGNHGDTGPGYGTGSITTKENDFGKSITGHVHKSEKLRQTLTVGSMLPFHMFYLKGNPIAWTHSHAMVYRTGVQMHNIIKGKYK